MFQKLLQITILVLSLCMCIPCVFAQGADLQGSADYLSEELALEGSDESRLTDVKLPNIFEVIIRFLFALLILIALIFVVAFIYKRFFSIQFSLNQNEAMRVLEHKFLDTKRSLYLVEVAGKILVLGSGGETLNVLSEITDPEQLQNVYNVLDLKSKEMKTPDFKKLLSGLADTTPASNSVAEPHKKQEALASGMQTLKAKINKIKQMINER